MKNYKMNNIKFCGKSFIFADCTFTPLQTLNYGWSKTKKNSIGRSVSIYEYSYNAFYQIAKENGCKYVDIFEMKSNKTGLTNKVIPCGGSLMIWNCYN